MRQKPLLVYAHHRLAPASGPWYGGNIGENRALDRPQTCHSAVTRPVPGRYRIRRGPPASNPRDGIPRRSTSSDRIEACAIPTVRSPPSAVAGECFTDYRGYGGITATLPAASHTPVVHGLHRHLAALDDHGVLHEGPVTDLRRRHRRISPRRCKLLARGPRTIDRLCMPALRSSSPH